MCKDGSQNSLSASRVEYLSLLNDLNSWMNISSLGGGKEIRGKSLTMITVLSGKVKDEYLH